MTTYNTYQEAKVANPKGDIYKLDRQCCFICSEHGGVEVVMFTDYDSIGVKCSHEDYCMTVEEFLADGHKFFDGDKCLDEEGYVIALAGHHAWGQPDGHNEYRYILRAAALEGIKPTSFGAIPEKPRTKVEYVKVTDSIFDLRPDFEAGELFSRVNHARDYSTINNTQTLAQALHQSCCYRRIETPMTWKEELYDYLDSSCEMSDDFDGSFTIEIEGRPLEFNLNDDEFVDMCKLVASLNSVN